MEELQVTAHLKIHDGNMDKFKQVAEACMKIVREKDTGTLQYDWFLNEDQSECHVRECYRDSVAVIEHMMNLGDLMNQLVFIGDFSVEVYGTPSEKLLQAANGMDMKIYSFYQKI